ncbi:LysR substrate-binding domain-containing protein [Propioniciclava tarda]|uniref:LysR substrate-binding domain-containing protein n=1 Tax=Propioniciclava tarda TaxID=433330 RepID=A0A4Q9KPV0_PROTD|nr:LysR substrate-binding domain-containing protein [Propioniciclava tarda]TBT96375.1 hypothetical protein ET996_01600 [Propioniciclava tarda]SMO36668.1 LysR substrate binding domain-containing protein [Propioniciclava tarda]
MSPEPGLRVGFVPGVILRKWRTIFEERYPSVPIGLVEVAEAAVRETLDAGVVDFVFARLPVATDGVHVIRLYDEVPVVWVSKDHPISLFDEVAASDLSAERVLTEVSPSSIDQVVDGEAVLRVPLSVARTESRRDLVYRPVVDAEPTTIALVWSVDNENTSLDDFIGVVRGRTANSSRSARPSPEPREAKPAPRRPPAKNPPRAGAARPRPPRRGRRG